MIEKGFPDVGDAAYWWPYRKLLYFCDGFIIYDDRVVVPPSLRDDVLQIFHSRARDIVFWPGMFSTSALPVLNVQHAITIRHHKPLRHLVRYPFHLPQLSASLPTTSILEDVTT